MPRWAGILLALLAGLGISIAGFDILSRSERRADELTAAGVDSCRERNDTWVVATNGEIDRLEFQRDFIVSQGGDPELWQGYVDFLKPSIPAIGEFARDCNGDGVKGDMGDFSRGADLRGLERLGPLPPTPPSSD